MIDKYLNKLTQMGADKKVPLSDIIGTHLKVVDKVIEGKLSQMQYNQILAKYTSVIDKATKEVRLGTRLPGELNKSEPRRNRVTEAVKTLRK